jgi:excisionase family DNA binding protein
MSTEIPNVAPSQRYLTFRQFYEAAGIGRSKALDEINAGRLVAKKCGKKILIDREAVDAWFASLPPARGYGR